MKYFYHFEDKQHGPFELEELRDFHLPPEIPVWYEGMAEWQPASTIPELQDMYQAPSSQQQQVRAKPQGNPTLKFFRIALGVLLLIFTLGLVGSGLENDPIELTPFVMAVIFLGLGVWLIFKKSKFRSGNARNQEEYTAADGTIYDEQMNMLSKDDDYSDDGGDFD